MKITEISHDGDGVEKNEGKNGALCVRENKTNDCEDKSGLCVSFIVFVSCLRLGGVHVETSMGKFLRTSIGKSLSVVCCQLKCLHDSWTSCVHHNISINFLLEAKRCARQLSSVLVDERERKILFVMIFGEHEKVLRFSRDYFMLLACTDLRTSRVVLFFCSVTDPV